MIISISCIAAGLLLMVWSADRFVEGASAAARHFGMSPLLIGMVVVGFGTSTPEMLVSAMSALAGNPGIALGNAYGSNICNIALILGVSAVISPINVTSGVLKKELPILTGFSALAALQLWDGQVTRFEAGMLLGVFFGFMVWSLRQERITERDALESQMKDHMKMVVMPLKQALFWLTAGLGILIASSRLLVWGAVSLATAFGISDLVIGLTVVAVGTSLPEFASSVAAARKGAHDIAIGNIIGSNIFNTLAVVGIAGAINPMQAGPDVLKRDIPVMVGLTVSLFVLGVGIQGRPGVINRFEGAMLLVSYIVYTAFLVWG